MTEPLPAPPGVRSLPARALPLDVRDQAEFARGHLPGSGRMSPDEFAARRAELPSREAEVVVVHDEPAAACAAAAALTALGYRNVRWLERPLGSLERGHASREPAARLWRPSPFLERVAPALAPGRALDVAAGSGRDAVFLAGLGWRVEAWDHDAEALSRASELAARHALAIEVRTVSLEGRELPDPGAGWELVCVCRFLHRPLLPWLERAVAPGGALVYETFLRGQEAFGHPRQRRFLLEPGELARSFPALRTELYEESAPAGGPHLARLLARRPA